MEPPIELLLSPAEEPGPCAICESRETGIQCDSCEPSHRLCRECVSTHRDDYNAVLG
jgi:hypothetical protein